MQCSCVCVCQKEGSKERYDVLRCMAQQASASRLFLNAMVLSRCDNDRCAFCGPLVSVHNPHNVVELGGALVSLARSGHSLLRVVSQAGTCRISNHVCLPKHYRAPAQSKDWCDHQMAAPMLTTTMYHNYAYPFDVVGTRLTNRLAFRQPAGHLNKKNQPRN